RLAWYSAIWAGILLTRNYGLFGSMFGARNYTDFEPVAAGRGLPDDVSGVTAKDAEPRGLYGHDPTWVSWREIHAVDWEETALDGRARDCEPGETTWAYAVFMERDDPRRFEGSSWVAEGRTLRVLSGHAARNVR